MCYELAIVLYMFIKEATINKGHPKSSFQKVDVL